MIREDEPTVNVVIAAQRCSEPRAVEDVVTQDKRNALVAYESLADDEGLRQTVR